MCRQRHNLKLSRACAGICLALVMSIFVWEMGYKLEQYGAPHSAVHKLSNAKMLSRNEQTWVADGTQSSRRLTPAGAHRTAHERIHFAVAALPGRGLEPLLQSAAQRAEKRKQLTQLTLNDLHARPPPALA